MVSQLVSLGLYPSLSLKHVVVQELVAEDVGSLSLLQDELSSTGASISVWVRAWCILVRGEQLQ